MLIDFSGSGETHSGNLNATIAIVYSVVLYILRVLIDKPIPLNEGLLKHVRLKIPRGILNPKFYHDNSKSPAVVGGNTEVSQRLTDTLLKAFNLVACSQGTMNNLIFGNERFGFYETIGGGTGAGPTFNGADGVHHHMTNTRITDPEIMEHRYPVSIEKFSIRKNSGGKGKFNGGDGIERVLCFKEKLSLNILSQHRIVSPYGVAGGIEGAKGSQYVISLNGKKRNLNGMDGTIIYPGDKLIIKTPGGGGWGKLKS
jgi:5-oxoprolinase (ATP-hydrolysing)